jgi:hypothetical protein
VEAAAMSPIHVALRLALVSLALSAASADAQSQQSADRLRPEGIDQEGAKACKSVGTGRERKVYCEREPEIVREDHQIEFLLNLPALPGVQCEATAETTYSQRNTVARVESTIEIPECTVASGEMTLSVRVRDESGEIKPLEFEASWQRSDDQDVHLTADYPIGENVELMSVRVRRLRCTCADAASEASAEGAAPN